MCALPQFGGYAVDPIPTMKANQLAQQLRAAGKPVKEGFFVVAGYDAVRRAPCAVSSSLSPRLQPDRSSQDRNLPAVVLLAQLSV